MYCPCSEFVCLKEERRGEFYFSSCMCNCAFRLSKSSGLLSFHHLVTLKQLTFCRRRSRRQGKG